MNKQTFSHLLPHCKVWSIMGSKSLGPKTKEDQAVLTVMDWWTHWPQPHWTFMKTLRHPSIQWHPKRLCGPNSNRVGFTWVIRFCKRLWRPKRTENIVASELWTRCMKKRLFNPVSFAGQAATPIKFSSFHVFNVHSSPTSPCSAHRFYILMMTQIFLNRLEQSFTKKKIIYRSWTPVKCFTVFYEDT